MTECKNLSKPRWENYQFLWLLISFSGRTKQIFFLVIKLEPRLLSRLQPRKNNSVPTELDVSISAIAMARSNSSVFCDIHSTELQICKVSGVNPLLNQTNKQLLSNFFYKKWKSTENIYWLKLWDSRLAKQSTWMDRWVTLPWPEATHRFPVRLKFYVLLFLFPR